VIRREKIPHRARKAEKLAANAAKKTSENFKTLTGILEKVAFPKKKKKGEDNF